MKRAKTSISTSELLETVARWTIWMHTSIYSCTHTHTTRLKGQVASKYGLSTQPRLVDIIAAVPPAYKKALLPKLKAKPVRTASGIAVVAVMCKPHRCPHITFTGNICV